MIQESEYFGEIVETTTNHCVAQAWDWNVYADFGSMLAVVHDDYIVYVVVYAIKTDGIDQTRRAHAYRKTIAQLEKEQPQIFSFLKTSLSLVPLGYCLKSSIQIGVPPRPCPLHAFVRKATKQEIKQIQGGNYLYMKYLFSLTRDLCDFDELLYQLLMNSKKDVFECKESRKNFFVVYASLVGKDYRRLKSFIERIMLHF